MGDEHTVTVEATTSSTITVEDISEAQYQPPFEYTNGYGSDDSFFSVTPLIATEEAYMKR